MSPNAQKIVMAGLMAKVSKASKRRRVESEEEDDPGAKDTPENDDDPSQDSPRRSFEPSPIQQSQRRRSAMSPFRPLTFPPTSSPPQRSSPVSNLDLDSMIAIKDRGKLQVTKERKESPKRKQFMISDGNLSKGDREQ